MPKLPTTTEVDQILNHIANLNRNGGNRKLSPPYGYVNSSYVNSSYGGSPAGISVERANKNGNIAVAAGTEITFDSKPAVLLTAASIMYNPPLLKIDNVQHMWCPNCGYQGVPQILPPQFLKQCNSEFLNIAFINNLGEVLNLNQCDSHLRDIADHISSANDNITNTMSHTIEYFSISGGHQFTIKPQMIQKLKLLKTPEKIFIQLHLQFIKHIQAEHKYTGIPHCPNCKTATLLEKTILNENNLLFPRNNEENNVLDIAVLKRGETRLIELILKQMEIGKQTYSHMDLSHMIAWLASSDKHWKNLIKVMWSKLNITPRTNEDRPFEGTNPADLVVTLKGFIKDGLLIDFDEYDAAWSVSKHSDDRQITMQQRKGAILALHELLYKHIDVNTLFSEIEDAEMVKNISELLTGEIKLTFETEYARRVLKAGFSYVH